MLLKLVPKFFVQDRKNNLKWFTTSKLKTKTRLITGDPKMNKKFLQILFIILSLAIATAAQSNLNDPIPTDPNVKVGKLENGMTYYIRKNSKPEKRLNCVWR